MAMEPCSDYSDSQHLSEALIDKHALTEGVTWLLFRSDWYLLYAIPKQDVIATAGLMADSFPTLFGVYTIRLNRLGLAIIINKS